MHFFILTLFKKTGTDLIAAYIQLDEDKKQTILETINVSERIEKLLVFIKEEIEIIRIYVVL